MPLTMDVNKWYCARSGLQLNPLKLVGAVAFDDQGSFITNLMSFHLQCNLENTTLHCCLW